MQFPNPIVSELHIVGSQSRIDVDGTGGGQPTIWFSNLDRSVSSFINAPPQGSPIDFMGVGINTSDYDNGLGQHVHTRLYLSKGLASLGEIDAVTQQKTGGQLEALAGDIVMYWTPGGGGANYTARCRVQDGLVLFTGNANIGFCYDDASKELRRYNNGTVQDWTNLPLLNGWTAKVGYYAPQYRFTPWGTIQLRGTMTGGTSVDNTQIATMPVAPAALGVYGGPAITGGGSALKRVFYNTDGKLYCYGVSGTADIGLDGAEFSYK